MVKISYKKLLFIKDDSLIIYIGIYLKGFFHNYTMDTIRKYIQGIKFKLNSFNHRGREGDNIRISPLTFNLMKGGIN